MLYNTLSLLFTFTHFINGPQAAAFALALGLLVYLMTPPPPADWMVRIAPNLYYFLHWSWLGYLRLSQAFWPFFLIYNAVLLYIDYRITEGSFTVASWITMHIILALPIVYWTVAVWRCSGNCSWRWLAVAARWAVLLVYCDLALRWVIYQYYPQVLFTCQERIVHWGDCY